MPFSSFAATQLQPEEPGYLTLQVFRKNSADPVAGAAVRIYDQQNDEQPLYDLVTDSSGLTPTVELSAPSALYTLYPQEDFRPYAEYNVEVETDGRILRFEGVQVYAGQLAIQPAELTAMLRMPEGTSEVIRIDDNSLWGHYPPKQLEQEIKESPSVSPLVLPQVIIPEFIIVHNGAPNQAAADYQIPFTNYIKNVASSEIYPTWPLAALQANVLAILSFTMNRVFTEWYRNKGYSFTITASTAYDQKFTYGRTIYRTISQVVDDLFMLYIKRPNTIQPMFAQYCDGDRITCPGALSQWGSKTLADQGFDSVGILRKYYGSDIYLENALQVSGVPESYPGSAMRVGSRGESVLWVQRQLNVIRRNFPAIPALGEDGIFGEQTDAAVRKFQNIFKLAADGIVGRATWYKLSQIYTSVARLAEL